jgi:FKBP-type peptidyl-prolyl cis-trans isomerase
MGHYRIGHGDRQVPLKIFSIGSAMRSILRVPLFVQRGMATAMLVAGGFGLALPVAQAQENRPTTIQGKYSYALGHQFGVRVRDIVAPDLEYFEIEPFLDAMRSALMKQQPAMTEKEMDSVRRLTLKALRDKRKILAQMNSDRGREFREQFGNQPDVVRLKSGVLYHLQSAGEGAAPNRQDRFTVHFQGRFIDGSVFADTRQSNRAEEFSFDSIISGWQEVLPLMKPGSVIRLVVPPDLAYGERGLQSQGIPPNSTLDFTLELVEIK